VELVDESKHEIVPEPATATVAAASTTDSSHVELPAAESNAVESGAVDSSTEVKETSAAVVGRPRAQSVEIQNTAAGLFFALVLLLINPFGLEFFVLNWFVLSASQLWRSNSRINHLVSPTRSLLGWPLLVVNWVLYFSFAPILVSKLTI
jgi:hypothetical protein